MMINLGFKPSMAQGCTSNGSRYCHPNLFCKFYNFLTLSTERTPILVSNGSIHLVQLWHCQSYFYLIDLDLIRVSVFFKYLLGSYSSFLFQIVYTSISIFLCTATQAFIFNWLRSQILLQRSEKGFRLYLRKLKAGKDKILLPFLDILWLPVRLTDQFSDKS